MAQKQDSPYGAEKWSYLVTTLAILIGFNLSVVAFLRICSEECNDTHSYHLFGMPIEYFGMAYFAVLIVLHILARKNAAYHGIVGLLLLAGIGAEVWFIYIQKYRIGHWCPVCLGIVGSLIVAFISYAYSYLNIERKMQEDNMAKVKNRFMALSVLALGFLTAFLGVTKVDAMQAAENSIQEELYFGKSNSPVVVYFFTDWECPACRAVEPKIEEMFPNITKQARVVFVDFTIHPESLNFTPYNLSFMVHNKPEYLKLRDALSKISEKTGKPTEEQVEEAAKKLGVKYQQLDYADVKFGIAHFEKLGEQFKIDRTPSIAVVNRTTKKGVKLVGSDEITEEKVMKAINSLSQ